MDDMFRLNRTMIVKRWYMKIFRKIRNYVRVYVNRSCPPRRPRRRWAWWWAIRLHSLYSFWVYVREEWFYQNFIGKSLLSLSLFITLLLRTFWNTNKFFENSSQMWGFGWRGEKLWSYVAWLRVSRWSHRCDCCFNWNCYFFRSFVVGFMYCWIITK